MKKTLIVNYAGLGFGGVETYLHSLMLAALEKGNKVIWITTKYNVDSTPFQDIAENENIEKVFYNEKGMILGMGHPKLPIKASENVTMISFSQESFIWGEFFRMKYSCKSFDHFFVLMNFFAESTYPEDRKITFKFIKKYRKRLSNKIAHKLAETDSIRAFAQKHLIYYKDRYHLDISTSKEKCLKDYEVLNKLSSEQLRNKAIRRQKQFDIVACSRFDFPHKGFMVGLLGEFEKIHQKYSQTRLFIVGDGGSRNELIKRYESLNENTKNAIVFTGTLQPKELIQLYSQSNLSISLAGCVGISARMGIPSIVARHSTYNCEVYGFMHEAKSTLREDPGESVIPYIEEAINCDDDTYVMIGELGSNCLNKDKECDPLYILKETSKSNKPIVSRMDIFCSAMCFTLSVICKKIKNNTVFIKNKR